MICIATEKRRYEILSTMMPDAESFLEVREFVFQHTPELVPVPEPSTQGRLIGHVAMSGFMLLIGALPAGATLSFMDYKAQQDWQWAIVLGAAAAIAVAAVGGLLLGVAIFWHRHAHRDAINAIQKADA
jgi:hypothetical protein